MNRVTTACASALAALAMATTADAAVFTYAGTGGGLPDLVNFTSTLTVADSFRLTDVNLTLFGLQHTFWSDLNIYLTHNGVTVRITDSNGGSSDPNGDYTFDDAAPVSVAGIGIVAGSFRPIEALAAFNGMSAGGDWTLRIQDDAGIDAGRFSSWSLAVTSVPEPATWGLMIMGFGLTGATLRRRRPVAA